MPCREKIMSCNEICTGILQAIAAIIGQIALYALWILLPLALCFMLFKTSRESYIEWRHSRYLVKKQKLRQEINALASQIAELSPLRFTSELIPQRFPSKDAALDFVWPSEPLSTTGWVL